VVTKILNSTHDKKIKYSTQLIVFTCGPGISDTSENKSERFDSDNQINISRLISFLDVMWSKQVP
jgi:hypothetical protein